MTTLNVNTEEERYGFNVGGQLFDGYFASSSLVKTSQEYRGTLDAGEHSVPPANGDLLTSDILNISHGDVVGEPITPLDQALYHGELQNFSLLNVTQDPVLANNSSHNRSSEGSQYTIS